MIHINIITLFGSIIAFCFTVYESNKAAKAALRAESSWREEIFKIASSVDIDRQHILRLRASQQYQYAYIENDVEIKKAGDKVREKIGTETFNLYKKYVQCSYKNIEIMPEDKNKIRNLAIALLKYDFIKRGDNDYPILVVNIFRHKKEYNTLLDWINNTLENDK